MATILRSELEGENEAVQQQTRSYFARIYKSDVEIEKSNILLVGPTGTGKTLIA